MKIVMLKMWVLQNTKIIIIILALIMLGIQLKIATQSLMSPPTVDSTFERKITKDDLPLIIICPRNQANYTRLQELQYASIYHLLEGSTECNGKGCTSWGAHQNLTLQEMMLQIYDKNKASYIYVSGVKSKEGRVILLPTFGFCREFSEFDPSKLMIISNSVGGIRIFITDKSYRSFTMPDISSHVGNKISTQENDFTNIDVEVEIFSSCNIDQTLWNQTDFQECVEEKVQDFFGNHFDCVPPWWSVNNQCSETYSLNTFNEDVFFEEFFMPLYIFAHNKIETACKKSCRSSRYKIYEREIVNEGYFRGATISFSDSVLVTEKEFNYNLFQYIIDIGSSFGLWLGLSVLGLYDLVVTAANVLNNIQVIKRILSAISK